MVLYVSILMSSSLLRNSMGNERKNRTMETLLLSVGPRQLLAGKIVGLAILGVLQTAVWVGGAYLGLGLGGQALNLPPDFHLSVATVFWAVVFSLLGYAVYASLLAGLGALSGPNAMGSSTADFVVIWPLIIPLFFLVFLIQYPNGTLAVALSLFPLTAPVAMVTRLAGGGIPLWQPVLGAALLVGTAFFVLRAVARVFQAQYLLSGQDLSFKGYLSVLLGRASGRGA
jgi:ABC-2 type transport system permease protein